MSPKVYELRNFDAIRNQVGQARIDEIFTALLLAFGPPHVYGLHAGQTLTGFRDLLETLTGLSLTLHDTLPWLKEYRLWFEDQKTRLCITTTARK